MAEFADTPHDPLGRAALLKSWALAAGFDRVGVARLGRSTQGEAFLAWLERGDHAGMTWMEDRVDARLDPEQLLPGARSVLVVALHYHPLAEDPEPSGDLWPRVARYARGQDYHHYVKSRLTTLKQRVLAAFPGCDARVSVDISAVLERELAARAGLGVQGKHTVLLDREVGSWFVLGELMTTLDLAPDEPLAEVCGRCTRCLEACPTGALPAPYRLDANRCISYWTIEHRGDLPPAARELVGDWVFGCDICQEVCPFNVGFARRGDAVADHPELRLPPERRELDLAGLLALPREAYVERFRGSPMKRAKLVGLQRNVAVAMGHRGDPAYVAPLAEALDTADPLVRRHAAWALGRIGTAAARAALEAALPREQDRRVWREIHTALAEKPAAALT